MRNYVCCSTSTRLTNWELRIFFGYNTKKSAAIRKQMTTEFLKKNLIRWEKQLTFSQQYFLFVDYRVEYPNMEKGYFRTGGRGRPMIMPHPF